MVGDAQHDGVPWGRPPVRTVPVPPFEDASAAREFVRRLALYIAAWTDELRASRAEQRTAGAPSPEGDDAPAGSGGAADQ